MRAGSYVTLCMQATILDTVIIIVYDMFAQILLQL